ncbi:hypothetical protein Hypma_016534 [Hypsizygus marmoreus]|uniref:F-box domain-containing protein n=1 Tax=Hypsizygus marmoreus TaxID=39966 RepID=A0A369J6Y9_HYPMA|nr:hypothetical protein Hypma_016534 [Hypsizygus marmoreus]
MDVMSSSNMLPQEIFEMVLDELHEDRQALKQCALAWRNFVPRSQQHLFCQVYILTTSASRHLHDILTVNAFLTQHIHSLELSDIFAWIEKDSYLPVTLSLMPSLKSLSINSSSNTATWANIPESTRIAIEHIIRLSSLVHLRISVIGGIPLDLLFGPQKHLRSLVLQATTFADSPDFQASEMTTDILDIVLIMSGALTNQRKLDVLTRPGAVFSQIKVLIVRVVTTPSFVYMIMGASAASLETIEIWNIFCPLIPDDSNAQTGQFQFNFSALPALRRLTLISSWYSRLPDQVISQCTTALRQVRNFIAFNPSVARVCNFCVVLSVSTVARAWAALLPEVESTESLGGGDWKEGHEAWRVEMVVLDQGTPVEPSAAIRQRVGMLGKVLHGELPRTGRGVVICEITRRDTPLIGDL